MDGRKFFLGLYLFEFLILYFFFLECVILLYREVRVRLGLVWFFFCFCRIL